MVVRNSTARRELQQRSHSTHPLQQPTTSITVKSLRLTLEQGAGQARVISGYVGSTKVATVDRAWITNPDNTSVFTVIATDSAKLNSSLEIVAASVTGNVGGSVASVSGNVGGNVTGSVGSIGTGGITSGSFASGAINAAAIASSAITAAKFAADAIDSNALAASAVTEIQSGLATSSAVSAIQADTDDIQTRLPAALVSGRMDVSVGAYQTGLTPSSQLWQAVHSM